LEQLYLWLKDILLVIVALSFFQILIPESSMEKYLKFIFSLVILAAVLEPVIHLAGLAAG